MHQRTVIELGSYIVPAYAGMILAEQGLQVTKWTAPPPSRDPILGLIQGDELWKWINHGKRLIELPATHVTRLTRADIIIDNIRSATWEKWGVDPAEQADRLGCTWVSMRDDFDGRSFDVVAQARAWMNHSPYIPFYIGDTTSGLWVAFKALVSQPGHHVLRQAACLSKLVEGELVVRPDRQGRVPPWDEPGTYMADFHGARVEFKGELVREPVRDDEWRLKHLRHKDGRIVI